MSDCKYSWEIHMPKAFDATSLGYSVGNYAASGYDTDMLQSTVTDQTIARLDMQEI